MTPAERMENDFLNRPRLAAFREHIMASIPCVPDDDETHTALRAKRVDDALGIYLNYASRFIPARPRVVEYAHNFWTAEAMKFGSEIAALEAKITAGNDLGPHLSPNIESNGFTSNRRHRWEPMRDLALNAFGLHHLHIRAGGSNHLVFVAFDRARALFVMQGNHKSFDNGSLADAVAHVQAVTGWDIKGTLGTVNSRTPKERTKLARHCIGTFGEANGIVTAGAMLMSSGDAMRVRRSADFIIDQALVLDPMLEDRDNLDRLIPNARVNWGNKLDFTWLMHYTSLVLFERNTSIQFIVTQPFC